MNITTSHEKLWTDSGAEGRFTTFFSIIARQWRIFGAVSGACLVIAISLAYLLPSYWQVEIVVMPVSTGNSVNVGNLLAGGLGSLGGSIGAILGRSSDSEDESLAVLRSRELFDSYATQQNLLPILYASKWDADKHRWSVSQAKVPTLRQAYKLFNTKIRDIDLDRRSGIVTMSITWTDRAQAAKWAQGLIALANSQLRARAIQQAQENMSFLSGEMRRSGGEAQNALTTALANSYDRALQSYMSAKGQPDFAFQVIDAPTIPDERERVFPNRRLFAILGLICGLGLGSLAAWLMQLRSRPAAPAPIAVVPASIGGGQPALVVDLDGTLTVEGSAQRYEDVLPRQDVIEQLRRYAADGFRIVIMTSRNMRSFNNSVGRINAQTLPVVIAWLKRYGVPFDEVHVGKPWCGPGGFYVDDKAVRPSEFRALDRAGVAALLEREKG